jgi:hypothetical protein
MDIWGNENFWGSLMLIATLMLCILLGFFKKTGEIDARAVVVTAAIAAVSAILYINAKFFS